MARLVEAAQEVDVVDGVRRRHVAAGGQGQQGEHVRLHARGRVHAVAEGRRPVRPQDAPGPHQHLVHGVLGAVVQQHRGMAGEQVDADDELGHALVHEEVDGPPRLVVALARVDGDAAALLRVAASARGRAGPSCRRRPPRPRSRTSPSGMRDSSVLRMVSRHCCSKTAHVVEHGLGPEALEQLLHAPLAEPAAGEHRADVALEDVGEARVAQEDAEGLVVEHALAIDADRRAR